MPNPAINFMRRSANLFAAALVLSATRPVFRADYYVIDGISGKVASFVDYNDATHLLVQVDSSRQVVVPAAHADYAGLLCATFTGVENYQSNRTALSWAFWHGASACFSACLYTPTSAVNGDFTLLVVTHPANSSAGTVLSAVNSATSSALTATVGNGAALVATPTGVVDTPAASATARCVSFEFAGGNSPAAYALRSKGASLASGNSTNNATTGAPTVALKLGVNSSETVRMKNRWRELFFAPSSGAAYDAYTQGTYGLAA